MEEVKVYKSESMITFGAIALLAAITELTASPDFKAALGSWATFVIFILGVIGMWLRKYTTKPLAPIIKKKKPEPLNPLEQALKDDNEALFNED